MFAQTTIFVHLLHDVTAAKEFALDVHLRNSGPVRVGFDGCAQVFIGEDVDILVLLHAISIEEYHNVAAESALRHLASALHEHTNIVLFDPSGDVLRDIVVRDWLRLRLEVIVAVLISTTSSITEESCLRGTHEHSG